MDMIANSNKAANEGSKNFELGQQPHEFFNSKYLFNLDFLHGTEICVLLHLAWKLQMQCERDLCGFQCESSVNMP